MNGRKLLWLVHLSSALTNCILLCNARINWESSLIILSYLLIVCQALTKRQLVGSTTVFFYARALGKKKNAGFLARVYEYYFLYQRRRKRIFWTSALYGENSISGIFLVQVLQNGTLVHSVPHVQLTVGILREEKSYNGMKRIQVGNGNFLHIALRFRKCVF